MTTALPHWSRDETVLALWTAAGRPGERVRRNDESIAALARFLRSAGNTADRRFRNRHGVTRKVWRFMDRMEGRPVDHACAVEAEVWEEFGVDHHRLEEAAAMARKRIAAAAAAAASAPARGPEPVAGGFFIQRENIGAWLYLAVLDGLVLEGRNIVVKIGRSNDLQRRESELNFGLPRPIGLRWRIARSWYFPEEADAHQAEQAVLSGQGAAGRSVGGEFIQIPQLGLPELAMTCRMIIEGERQKRRHEGRRRPTSRKFYEGSSRQSRDTAATASS